MSQTAESGPSGEEENVAEEEAATVTEPSTEKTAEEEPKAPEKPQDVSDHNAVGIGVIGEPIDEEEQS